MNSANQKLSTPFVQDIKGIIVQARSQAVRSVEFHCVQMYWRMGERIFNEEQQGKDRADYGAYLIRKLAMEIEPEFGSGFTGRQLERCRQFYRTFPIASALRTQFNWTLYKMLLSIEDEIKREYYELEALKKAWTGREMERQINSGLYERLLLSNDKEAFRLLPTRNACYSEMMSFLPIWYFSTDCYVALWSSRSKRVK